MIDYKYKCGSAQLTTQPCGSVRQPHIDRGSGNARVLNRQNLTYTSLRLSHLRTLRVWVREPLTSGTPFYAAQKQLVKLKEASYEASSIRTFGMDSKFEVPE